MRIENSKLTFLLPASNRPVLRIFKITRVYKAVAP